MSDRAIRRVHAREILDSRGNPTVEVEVTLAGGAVGTAAVDQLSAAARHGLAVEGVAQQVRDRLADGLGGNAFVPAEHGRGPFLLQALGGRPVDLLLHDDQLRHADAGQFQGRGVAGRQSEMAAGDPRRNVGRLHGDLQPVGMGLGHRL